VDAIVRMKGKIAKNFSCCTDVKSQLYTCSWWWSAGQCSPSCLSVIVPLVATTKARGECQHVNLNPTTTLRSKNLYCSE